MKRILFASALLAVAASPAYAGEPPPDKTNVEQKGNEAQNNNNRDAMADPSSRARMSNQGLTADDQSNRPEATERTRKIRQLVMKDDNLSGTAKNVKIITTDDGTVTLRGNVESGSEKLKIAQLAKSVAGNANVRNEIRVEE